MRLTSGMRLSLGVAVMRHRFSDEIEKLISDRATFAADVYDDVFKKWDRELMASLPGGWLPEVQKVNAQFGESGSTFAQICFDGRIEGEVFARLRSQKKERTVATLRPVPNNKEHGCWKTYPDDHRISRRWTVLGKRFNTLCENIAAAQQQVDAALASATTVAALLKQWPEIEPFTKQICVESAKLPAIASSTLNATFKLPIKEAA